MTAPQLILPLGFAFLAAYGRGGLGPTTALCRHAAKSSLGNRTHGRMSTPRHLSSTSSNDVNLPTLLSTNGQPITSSSVPDLLAGKRVALYFAAGWCPMCTRFEPALIQFRDAANNANKPIELIYVPSDRSATDAMRRASSLQMMSVPHGEEADATKKQYEIWSGAESMKLGFGRRSGVPALVVLDG